MERPGSSDVKRIYSLFLDDLEVYQESQEILKNVNEVIVQVNNDSNRFYGVAIFPEIAFEKGKIVKGEVLQGLNEKIKALDPNKNEIYKLLGVEQADGIKMKEVYSKVKEEISGRINIITRTELSDKNLVKAINTKVISVAAYPINFCKFT